MNVYCTDMNVLYMYMHVERVLIWDVHVHNIQVAETRI